MASLQLVTQNFKLHNCVQLQESIVEAANTSYYLYCAQHMPFANNITPNVNDDNFDIFINPYRNMIFAKRVAETDTALMISRVDYQSNTVYAMYDDTDASLLNKNFYCVVNNGAYSHVFECLYNNNGGPSLVQPNFSDIDAEDEIYITSDNYQWKYMYSVSSTDVSKFATETFFPVIANTVVTQNAVNGSIDVIKVEVPGSGYDNYLAGQFSSEDLRRDGNSVIYAVSSNSTASITNTFYEKCYLYITSGTGIGQYKEIVSYTTNSTFKSVVISESFDVAPQIDSTFEISPMVLILGDGSQTINAAARAIVNAAGNTIDHIEILDRGADYQFANAQIETSPVVLTTSNTSLRVINSPRGGHGFYQAQELGAAKICFSVQFSNSESNTVVTTNSFRQIGLMKNPIFSSADLTVANTFGDFLPQEQVFVIYPKLLGGTVTLSSTSANVIGDATDFMNQFDVADMVLFNSANSYQMGIIQSITNSTFMSLTQNSSFDAIGAWIYQPNANSSANVTNSVDTILSVGNIQGIIQPNELIVGMNSGAVATVNSVSRNNVLKDFNTFIQMYKYTGTVTSGTFIENEIVYQNDLSIANAALHSVVNNDSQSDFYVTNEFGVFNPGTTLIGSTSGARASISAAYPPEVVYGSGTILYIENLDAITRDDNQSETFKLIFEF